MVLDNPTRIRMLRLMRNLRQEDLARMSGVPNTIISQIESRAQETYEQRLLDALGYTPALDANLEALAQVETPA